MFAPPIMLLVLLLYQKETSLQQMSFIRIRKYFMNFGFKQSSLKNGTNVFNLAENKSLSCLKLKNIKRVNALKWKQRWSFLYVCKIIYATEYFSFPMIPSSNQKILQLTTALESHGIFWTVSVRYSQSSLHWNSLTQSHYWHPEAEWCRKMLSATVTGLDSLGHWWRAQHGF